MKRPPVTDVCCRRCRKPLTPGQLHNRSKFCCHLCSTAWTKETWEPHPDAATSCSWCRGPLSKRQMQSRAHLCCRSCAASWRCEYTGTKANIETTRTPEAIAKSLSVRQTPGSRWRESVLSHMNERNPMRDPATRSKQSATLRAMGHKPRVRGGNGRGLTWPQAFLLLHLGRRWIAEHIVTTGAGTSCPRPRPPTHYKLDLACPSKRIAVEVDGSTHNSLKVQAADKRKDAFLRSTGWTVLRVSNASALSGEALARIAESL